MLQSKFSAVWVLLAKYRLIASTEKEDSLLEGLQMGAKAETDLYLSGFLAAIIKEPFPPML